MGPAPKYLHQAPSVNWRLPNILECEINVPAGIKVPAGKVYENDKHASLKIWFKLKLGPKNGHIAT